MKSFLSLINAISVKCLTIVFLIISFSCLKDELPGNEADIIGVTVEEYPTGIITFIQNDIITLLFPENSNTSSLTLDFIITEGASLSPQSRAPLDYTFPQHFTVTSEDQRWSKTYTIVCMTHTFKKIFTFNGTIENDARYATIGEIEDGKIIMEWADGNSGFTLTGTAHHPEDFPTQQDANGYEGKCAKLVTKSTGSFGELLKMPIATGNLYIGQFDTKNALTNIMAASHMGFPFYEIPYLVSGYYKYFPGKDFWENGEINKERTDLFDIYAVFFETNDQTPYLDGINVFTHPNILAIAQIENQKPAKEWTKFEIPFVYKIDKTIDREKLLTGKYSLTIVFSSSYEGNIFNGAPESTLYIDNVEILANAFNTENEE